MPAYSIESLIRLAAERCQIAPFILKIDIEGFESRLFDGEAGKAIDAFYALADRQGWVLGETFERAIEALERVLSDQK